MELLVAALRHESPYCVAAGAVLLTWVAQKGVVDRARFDTSGVIPALLHAVEKLTPPADLEKETGLFCR